jgi:hypothetical protein
VASEHYDVFISYRRESDAAEARLIRSALTSRGLSVFLDVEDLKRGHFDLTLLSRIASAPNFLVILSSHSLDRCVDEQDWLRQEIAQAIKTGRNVIPVMMPSFQFPRELPPDIRDLPRHQGVEYSHRFFDATIDKIMDSVVGFHPSVIARLQRYFVAGGIIVLLVLGVLGVLRWQSLRRKALSITVVPSQPNGQSVRNSNGTAPSDSEAGRAVVGPSKRETRRTDQLGKTSAKGSATASPPKVLAEPEGFQTVSYGSRNEGTVTYLFYKLPYLAAFRSGSVPGLQYRDCPFEWHPAELLVTAVNNTSTDMMLNAVVLKIESSVVDTEPLIVVDSNSTNNLLFTNQGWGDVLDPVVEFTFDEPAGAVSLFAPPKQTVHLETFAETSRISIKQYLTDDLRSQQTVGVTGRIEYGPIGHRRSLSFHTQVLLRIYAGAPAPPNTIYDVEYKAGETGLVTVQLQDRQEVRPGSSAVFLLRMKPDKTSKTRMTVNFQTNDGELLGGGDFVLDLFVPRCHELSFVRGAIEKRN